MALVRTRMCGWCSKEFTCSQHSREYCSISCRNRIRWEKVRKKNFVKCRVCKTRFQQGKQQHPFCSLTCRHTYHVNTQSEKVRERADPLFTAQKLRFLATGAFSLDTVFVPSGERDNHTIVHCPDCGQSGEGRNGNLRNGFRPCECSPSRMRQAYIHTVYDTNSIGWVKFGVAVKAERRAIEQNRRCIYNVENFGVWGFETKKACLAAERECKQTLECGVLTKEEMSDGYTETTWVYNLEKIIAIYEKHGGVRVEDVPNNLET